MAAHELAGYMTAEQFFAAVGNSTVRRRLCLVIHTFVRKTLPLPCLFTAFVLTTLPLHGGSTAFVAKTPPLPGDSHRLRLASPLPFVS